jgi:site-specific recombinase XerD
MSGIGSVLFGFFEDHLKVQKGLRPGSVSSYRDTLKLFLGHIAQGCHRPITKLRLSDLSAQHVLDFLRMIEIQRRNGVATRNQRLAALHTFYRYLALQHPEMLREAERVEAIPTKRSPPPQTRYLERDEVDRLFEMLPLEGAFALRDRALLMLLYNTGARAQEVVELRVGDVDLDGPLRIRLHGKGDKWRSCPIWPETAVLLKQLDTVRGGDPKTPLFESRRHEALSRFGIYKLVRRHTQSQVACDAGGSAGGRISPHTFRRTCAVHLLESGAEANVVRAWLGHVSLDTTNRYAEITLSTKRAAMAACLPPTSSSTFHSVGRWSKDQDLLNWLRSL